MANRKIKIWMDSEKRSAFYTEHKKLLIYLCSAFLPMAVMLIVWRIMAMYPFGSSSLMAVDFGQQYISFFAYLKNTLLSGDWSGFFYSFTKSIGGEMIGVVGYYLLSPFNIIYILTPLQYFPLAVFLTIWLRYGLIGLTFAHLLIRRYQGLSGKVWLVPLMALAYTLSGMLVSYQMNVIFYDAMWMLPLIIIYLEETLDGGKIYPYILTLALAMLFQFYFGVMICIFIALYACYYVSPNLGGKAPLKEKIQAFFSPLFKVVGASVLAITSVFALLYPLYLNLASSKGQVGSALSFSWSLQINPLDILSKLIIGSFDNNSWPSGPSLPNIYVGGLALVGFLLYFAYAKASLCRKLSAGLVSLVFFLSFINEFASKLWHMGQNPAGFFFRFSWLFSFFMVLLAYQFFKDHKPLSVKPLILGLVLITGTVYYVSSKDFTYIAKSQPELVTSFFQTYRELVTVLLGLISVSLAYCFWTYFRGAKHKQYLAAAVPLLLLPLVIFLLAKGYLLTQLTVTAAIWLLVLLLIYFRLEKTLFLLLTAVTVFELGWNAYLSQSTLGYADAYKFTDAVLSVGKVTDTVQAESEAGFYRIGSTFAYSRTVPTFVSYPGLSTFSSTIETSTQKLFSYLGDSGVNASTMYLNGTALTDALYGVRYYIDVKDYTNDDVLKYPRRWYYSRLTERKDLSLSYTNLVYEDDRYLVYENPNVLSLAFGTNKATTGITFGLNNAAANQNFLLQQMAGTKENYFESFDFATIETDNMQAVTDDSGQTAYNRLDRSKPGIIRYKLIPKSNYTYYFFTPFGVTDANKELSVLLNGKWYNNQKSFDQRQLWQLTDDTEGQETVLEFQFTADSVNMTGAQLVRANKEAIKNVMAERQKQSMTVDKWSNTKIEGSVNITDDSDMMMTTIPYSEGWHVQVDGKAVDTQEAWESLIAFPISSGKHSITMTFRPPGLYAGIAISVLSISSILVLRWYDKKTDKKAINS
ncbi:YfhO family protein [Streptococcus sp. H49]|uniref:glycosyltransferase PgfM1 n=1 Tax=Streptococcus huangxiaojuni TaxID=3237239 RepID=UPI0034A2B2AA